MARLAVVYYSRGGNLRRMAEEVRMGAEEHGAQVRLVRVQDWPGSLAETSSEPAGLSEHPPATTADLEWADGVAFGTPAMFGNVAAALKHFIDSAVGLWQEGKLADKVVAGFTCAGSLHGGHESALLALYQSMYHWGSLILPMGYTDPSLRAAGGNPYGVSAQASQDESIDQAAQHAARYLGMRLDAFAERLLSAPVILNLA
jgi:NAD(P)H dehydrogenase (quinone)